ncbi:MAG: glycerophosphodiester phosphodiesterase [Muribaculaceae bacterium]
MKFIRLLNTALFGLGLCSLAFAAEPLVVAHRGYWKTDGSAQNSLRAIVKADSVGCFGSEFDVWITGDDSLVVNHDSSINDIVIETATAREVLSQKLENGEYVPTLDAYFRQARNLPGLRLICELKPHVSNEREAKAIKGILELAHKYQLEDRIDYITFSRNGFVQLCKEVPEGTPVYYLTGDFIPEQIKFYKGSGIDYSLWTMRRHPEWFDECHKLGLKVNVWTVNDPADMQWCIDHGADFITTNEPEVLQNLLKTASEIK